MVSCVVGRAVGYGVGLAVGCGLGTAVGCIVRSAVGCGVAVGSVVGRAVGCVVSCVVCGAVGRVVGRAVGCVVGCVVSRAVLVKLPPSLCLPRARPGFAALASLVKLPPSLCLPVRSETLAKFLLTPTSTRLPLVHRARRRNVPQRKKIKSSVFSTLKGNKGRLSQLATAAFARALAAMRSLHGRILGALRVSNHVARDSLRSENDAAAQTRSVMICARWAHAAPGALSLCTKLLSSRPHAFPQYAIRSQVDFARTAESATRRHDLRDSIMDLESWYILSTRIVISVRFAEL